MDGLALNGVVYQVYEVLHVIFKDFFPACQHFLFTVQFIWVNCHIKGFLCNTQI